MRKPAEFFIESERLVARPWASDDRAALERMVADADMMRYLTHGRAWPAADVDEFFARQARQLGEHGVCMGPLECRGTGNVVGVAGIQPLDMAGDYELGWWVWKAHWGLGYAPEIAQALVAFAKEAMGLRRVVAVIDPANRASIRVATKVGMHYERTVPARETAVRRNDDPVVVYALEW
jgi:[ribosomal protein S5]-alanine N-acetyltransferase